MGKYAVAYFSFGSEGKRRSGRRKKDRHGKSPADAGVEDIIGKGSAVAERRPLMPQTVLLRAELSPALRVSPRKWVEEQEWY